MLRYLWIPVIAAGALMACGGDEPAESEPDFRSSSSETVAAADSGPDGERIFKTRCVTCHGSKGNMGANGAANLQHSELAVMERVQVITHGRKTMNAFKNILEPAEIKAVAEYTLTLKTS